MVEQKKEKKITRPMTTFKSSITDFNCSFSFINFAMSSALACKNINPYKIKHSKQRELSNFDKDGDTVLEKIKKFMLLQKAAKI